MFLPFSCTLQGKRIGETATADIPRSDLGGIGVCCSIRGSVLRRKDLENKPHWFAMFKKTSTVTFLRPTEIWVWRRDFTK